MISLNRLIIDDVNGGGNQDKWMISNKQKITFSTDGHRDNTKPNKTSLDRVRCDICEEKFG
jgi:hypothetical protein